MKKLGLFLLCLGSTFSAMVYAMESEVFVVTSDDWSKKVEIPTKYFKKEIDQETLKKNYYFHTLEDMANFFLSLEDHPHTLRGMQVLKFLHDYISILNDECVKLLRIHIIDSLKAESVKELVVDFNLTMYLLRWDIKESFEKFVRGHLLTLIQNKDQQLCMKLKLLIPSNKAEREEKDGFLSLLIVLIKMLNAEESFSSSYHDDLISDITLTEAQKNFLESFEKARSIKPWQGSAIKFLTEHPRLHFLATAAAGSAATLAWLLPYLYKHDSLTKTKIAGILGAGAATTGLLYFCKEKVLPKKLLDTWSRTQELTALTAGTACAIGIAAGIKYLPQILRERKLY